MSTVRNDYDTPDGTGVRVAVPNCPEWREDGTVAVLLAVSTFPSSAHLHFSM